jgi:hypothetical protein
MNKGPGGDKLRRPPRVSNVPQEDDEQTQLELEMAASGRGDVVPREGLVGAHTARREPLSRGLTEGEELEEQTAAGEEGAEPTGPGSDVAPTKRAEERERERHRLERELGRTPAGEDGLIHDRRAPGISREHLDEAARQADRYVADTDLPKKAT